MSTPVEITLMGRTFSIVSDEDPAHVQAAAELVQQKVEELRQMGASVASDRLLALVSLNLAGELLAGKETKIDGLDTLLSSLDHVVLQAEGLAKAPLR
ncbi:MAG: cell division protein ZapA [Zetaproteobacteria bacterium CG12_big_fil_rev_8_21_14_0_65_54_13]|nr:MAG: cell division protein ZapA [Zetaproteobacteria bacterium CG23_combo_of_CG06-09_8_20_14_all_54_7]PIW50795.1 MAG: cell division protein ZapA [Zetaproteobacteria bacterium CG12_big_fil_rev_8_21_14_0_65_54_13]PIX55292.1 MAG: cell division protein ZapA [Zetaproteobacteria bacterium CG_4_10_14_3_um_filter_54_28]PJA26866.1 MAG: cell division protein ZapA [Zetaproteobacteria bacterium CG_4_9_14_3_um_filter_54_145]